MQSKQVDVYCNLEMHSLDLRPRIPHTPVSSALHPYLLLTFHLLSLKLPFQWLEYNQSRTCNKRWYNRLNKSVQLQQLHLYPTALSAISSLCVEGILAHAPVTAI